MHRTRLGLRFFCGYLFSILSMLAQMEPDSMTIIRDGVFYNCISLKSLILKNINGWFISGSADATTGAVLF